MDSTEREDGGSNSGSRRAQRREGRTRRVLDALRDEECRRILGELASDRLTAADLSDGSAVSMSSLYRKLDRLREAGLIAESGQLGTDGRNAVVYRANVGEVRIDVDSEGRLFVETTAVEE
jgi:DNA-binding transcriptional ArsR family regulator